MSITRRTTLWDRIISAAGSLILNNGTFNTTFNQTVAAIWKWANTTPTFASLVLTQATVSGGSVTYTGTITGGGSNAYVGATATIAGFVNGGNNGAFVVTASTATTLVCTNAGGVNETHAGTAVGAAQSSPTSTYSAQYSTSPIGTAEDTWTVQSVLGSTAVNATSALRFTHAGSSGQNWIEAPRFLCSGTEGTGLVMFGSTGNQGYGMAMSSGQILFLQGGVSIFNFGNGKIQGGLQGNSGANWTDGHATELLVLSTIGLTTDTLANLLPAGAIITSVVCRVNVAITTATDWAVGDANVSNRFSSANATKTIGTTSIGLNHLAGSVNTDNAGPTQAAAAKIRITCTGSNPGAGTIRIVVYYRNFVAPTS